MVFDGSEPRLALYSSLISHFRNFRKKLKNRCQNGSENPSELVQKSTLGWLLAPDCRLFRLLEQCQKMLEFRSRLGRPKNRKSLPKGRQKELRMLTGSYFGQPGSPGQPRARPESRKRPVGKRQKDQRERRQVEKWKKRKVGKDKLARRKRKRDLTRQWARGPANFT